MGQTTTNPAHIDDVVEYLKSCSDAFTQIAAILSAIEDKAPEFGQLRALAGAGFWIASDFENMANSWREEVKKNGVRMK